MSTATGLYFLGLFITHFHLCSRLASERLASRLILCLSKVHAVWV